MSQLSRKIDVQILENMYTVKVPNTGELMDIDLLKVQITNGRYDILKFSVNPMFQNTAAKVDAVAFLNTMVPDLKKHLNVKSFFDLEEDQMQVLVRIYEDEILPWFEEWMTALATPQSTDADKDKK